MTLTKRATFLTYFGVLSVLIGVAYSVVWIYPVLLSGKHHVPIRHQMVPMPFVDDYLYFSQVQEVLHGNLLWKDPSSFEGKQQDRTPVHASYSFALVLGSLGGWFTGNAAHAYYFALFFFTALATFLMATLAYRISDSIVVSAFAVLGALYYNYGMDHFPHPLVTQIPLLLLALFLFRTDRVSRIGVAILVGLSPLLSAPNFFISFGLLFVFLVLAPPKQRKEWFLVSAAAGVLALPSIWLLFKNRHVFEELLDLAMPPVSLYTSFHWNDFFRQSAVFVGPLALFSVVRYRNRDFVVKLYAGLLLAYTVLCFYHGTFTGGYIPINNGRTLHLLLLFTGLGIILVQFRRPSHRVKRGLIALATAGLLFVMLARANTKFADAKYAFTYQQDAQFRELIDWGREKTHPGDVALTLDFDVMLNLIIYAPIDNYIPEAIMSPLPTADRERRFFETLHFYGITPDQLAQWLAAGRDMKQMLGRLYLYYGKYWLDDAIFPADRKRLVEAYRATPTTLTSRHTHLIISTESDFVPAPDSPAGRVIAQNKPVFENRTYRVYQLNPS